MCLCSCPLTIKLFPQHIWPAISKELSNIIFHAPFVKTIHRHISKNSWIWLDLVQEAFQSVFFHASLITIRLEDFVTKNYIFIPVIDSHCINESFSLSICFCIYERWNDFRFHGWRRQELNSIYLYVPRTTCCFFLSLNSSSSLWFSSDVSPMSSRSTVRCRENSLFAIFWTLRGLELLIFKIFVWIEKEKLLSFGEEETKTYNKLDLSTTCDIHCWVKASLCCQSQSL